LGRFLLKLCGSVQASLIFEIKAVGATTLSIMTLWLSTFSIRVIKVTFSIRVIKVTFSITVKSKCYAECRNSAP
jgi:hypothetical protein